MSKLKNPIATFFVIFKQCFVKKFYFLDKNRTWFGWQVYKGNNMHWEGLSLDYFQHSNPISHLPISLHKVSYYRWQWKWQWASLLLDARVWRIGESINAKRIIFWLGTAAHCFHLLLYSNERRRESLQIGFLLMHKIFRNIPRKSYFYNFCEYRHILH